MKFINEIKNIRYFLLISGIFILVGLFAILTSTKSDIHLWINARHNDFFDLFFKYFTYLGDGGVTAIAILPLGLMIFKKYRSTPFIIGWGTMILCGVFAQVLKRLVFPGADRPLKFFGDHVLYLVPDLDIHMSNSFPSGHTTTAFGFYAFIAVFFASKKPWLQFVLAMTAVLVGYSRMYLSQHFLEDVVTGALLGITALMMMLLVKTKLTK